MNMTSTVSSYYYLRQSFSSCNLFNALGFVCQRLFHGPGGRLQGMCLLLSLLQLFLARAKYEPYLRVRTIALYSWHHIDRHNQIRGEVESCTRLVRRERGTFTLCAPNPYCRRYSSRIPAALTFRCSNFTNSLQMVRIWLLGGEWFCEQYVWFTLNECLVAENISSDSAVGRRGAVTFSPGAHE